MLRKTFIIVSLVGIGFVCKVPTPEKALLQWKIGSLKSELEASRKDVEALLEVGRLIDSIDANRFDVVANLREGKTPFKTYKYRLKAIDDYVTESGLRIRHLEERVSKIRTSGPGMTEAINRLNEKIRWKNRELAELSVRLYRCVDENRKLFRQVSLQEAQYNQNEAQLNLKEKELEAMNAKVAEAQDAYREMMAELYYGQAEAVEVKADRTRFAGAKKRAALKEVLDLYRKALFFGKNEAQARIAELEEEME